MNLRVPLSLLCVGLTMGACQEPGAQRTAWLVEQLTRDNRIWWTREPDRLEIKYRKMADDPYNYMRGTAAVFLRDLERPGTGRRPTAFLRSPGATEMVLMGDPHPENVGGHLPGWPPPPDDSGFRLDFNDFDGVGYGPWIWDVRRGAVGLAMLMHPISRCPVDPCRQRTLEAYAEGYAAQILAPQSLPDLQDAPAWGAIVQGLTEQALEEGRRRRRLFRSTQRNADGEVTLSLEEPRDDGRATYPLTDDERRQVQRLVEDYQGIAPEGFRLLDAVHRWGRGVASLPAHRYVWLWDTGDPSMDDDRLFQVREFIDPPPVPGLWRPVEGLFQDQVHRVRASAEALWTVPASDPLLAGIADGTMTFKVVTWSGYTEGFDHDDIAEDAGRGRIGPSDFEGLGRFIGALLASAHTRSPTASGRDSHSILRDELHGHEDLFIEEIVEGAWADLERTLDDYVRLNQALNRLGPLLGAEHIYTDRELQP